MILAEEMLDYCRRNKYGRCLSEEWSLKHFAVIENTLFEDEVVHMTFLDLGNIVHYAQEKTQKAYAITNERLLIGQSKKITNRIETIDLDNITNIDTFNSIMKGVVVIETKNGKITIDLPKDMVEHIGIGIERILFDMQQKYNETPINSNKPMKEKEENPDTLDDADSIEYKDRFNEEKVVLDDVKLDGVDIEEDTTALLNFGQDEGSDQTYKSLLDDGILTPDEYDELVNK